MADERYINAEQVVDKIEEFYCKECDSGNEVLCRSCGYMDCIEMIETGDFLTADVQEVKHGKWKQVDDTKCRCSNCKKVFLIAVYPNGGEKNYCPNCGAKMDLKE